MENRKINMFIYESFLYKNLVNVPCVSIVCTNIRNSTNFRNIFGPKQLQHNLGLIIKRQISNEWSLLRTITRIGWRITRNTKTDGRSFKRVNILSRILREKEKNCTGIRFATYCYFIANWLHTFITSFFFFFFYLYRCSHVESNNW